MVSIIVVVVFCAKHKRKVKGVGKLGCNMPVAVVKKNQSTECTDKRLAN